MRRLILLRHAKTEREADSGEDFDRALTEKGRTDAERIGKALAAAGLTPDLALVSPALRTRQTWAGASSFLSDARMELVDAIYEAAPETVLDLARAAESDTVLIVGHNPAMHMAAQTLLRGALADAHVAEVLSQGMSTAQAAAFEFAEARRACLGLFGPDGPA